MLVERIMNKLKSLSIAPMLLPQPSLYRRRIPLFLSDIPVAVSNCRLYCHLLFALNPLSIHSLYFIKGLARPISLYKPRRQEWCWKPEYRVLANSVNRVNERVSVNILAQLKYRMEVPVL